VLKNPENNVVVEFISAENYPYLQLYIPDHRETIAIENLGTAPDSFNNGMGLYNIKPGEEISFNVCIRTLES
jgi:aldose 1-epimerase